MKLLWLLSEMNLKEVEIYYALFLSHQTSGELGRRNEY